MSTSKILCLKQFVFFFGKYSVNTNHIQLLVQPECVVMDKKGVAMILPDASDEVLLDKSSGPNKLSEDILKCLMNIFLSIKSSDDMETSSSSSGSCENIVGMESRDPYDICAEFGKRDIGPYKHFRSVDVSSNSQKLLMALSFFKHRLKCVLKFLLYGLTV